MTFASLQFDAEGGDKVLLAVEQSEGSGLFALCVSSASVDEPHVLAHTLTRHDALSLFLSAARKVTDSMIAGRVTAVSLGHILRGIRDDAAVIARTPSRTRPEEAA